MSDENIAIKVSNLSKCYHVYDQPHDRLKQSFYPSLQRLLSKPPRRYFREFWALKDVSFEVGKGETVGIIGRNGSGKSTLLQLICGTLEPTAGAVETRGRVAALLELGAGFNPEFTGRENVYMNATVLGLSQKEIHSRFDDIAAFADIGDFIEQPVKHYSSGMYARLAFAVAINVDPSILIVDEALAVGDEPFQRKCFARIEEIKRKGGTILFVSHSSNAIVDLCDRAVLLYNGERLFTGEPKKAVSWYQKLMNATSDRSAEICTDINREDEAMGVNSGVTGPMDIRPRNGLLTNYAGKDLEGCSTGIELNSEERASYDASLVSKSIISYESNGAIISNPRILTQDGRIVNCLVNGERYQFCYDVVFNKNCVSVRFYNLIKTVTGTELGGGTYPLPSEEGNEFAADEKLTMGFEFECMLNAGTYFFNCGVGGHGGQSLHRIIDALPFRVLAKKMGHSFGVVDFGYNPTLSPLLAKIGTTV
jgi:lipopolysaccharide transport system ATP-binding protein